VAARDALADGALVSRETRMATGTTSMRIPVALTLIVLLAAGCQKYVPANLPLQLGDSSDVVAYQDDLGRTIGAADADGPEYRLTLQDGTQFFMKSGRIRGDSVIGYYRPTKESEWARVAVELYDVRLVEQQQTDWLATISLATVPITLALLFTLD
jgi:hypothetical protein